MPSITNEVLAERMDNIKEVMERWILENKEEHRNIRTEMLTLIADHELRIKSVENWRLIFVTKFTVYSTIGLVVGSFAAQIALKYLDKWI